MSKQTLSAGKGALFLTVLGVLSQVLSFGYRVALSRLRRMCMAAALGLNAGLTAGEPPYIRVLAADEKGRAFLRRSAGESPIPVVTKPAVIRQLGGRAEALFALGASAHDLYTLSFLSIEDRKGGSDWRTGPKIV